MEALKDVRLEDKEWEDATAWDAKARQRCAELGMTVVDPLALGVIVLVVVIWVTTQSALTAYHYGRVSAVMLDPLWLPMAFIPAGLALMALTMAVALVTQVRLALGPGAARDEVAPEDDAG